MDGVNGRPEKGKEMIEYIVAVENKIDTDGSQKILGKRELIRCGDCRHYYKGHCQCDDTIYWCRDKDWFCANGERQ